MKPKLLCIGGGFATAATIIELTSKFDVTVIDAASNPGGGNWTQFCGGHPYTFGPRVFFSDDERAVAFAEKFLNIRKFYTKSISYLQKREKFFSYPLQRSEVEAIPDFKINTQEMYDGSKNFEDYWKFFLGDTLYNEAVCEYSKKMWGVESNRQLTTSWNWVNKGTPLRDGDDRLFKDVYQGYPENLDGYNPFFEKVFSKVNLRLNERFIHADFENKYIFTSHSKYSFDFLLVSIPVDQLLDFRYGSLKYSGRTFLPIVLPVEYALPPDITWVHYSGAEPFTRVTEFKKITNYRHSSQTLIGVEIPSPNGRYYPVQSDVELLRYRNYTADLPDSVFLVGRHGTFQYKGIPDVILDGISMSDKLRSL